MKSSNQKKSSEHILKNKFFLSFLFLIIISLFFYLNLTNAKTDSIDSKKTYIIQLKEEPLALKYKELTQKSTTLSEQNEFLSYIDNLRKQKENLKISILNKLKKSNPMQENPETSEKLNILQDYENIFNGFAIELTEQEANQIKSLPEIKEIYLDQEVEINLMNSIPLIKADQIWQIDKQGNNCIKSGEECLTGKGITIAIIDAGIDSTHPDLGGTGNQDYRKELIVESSLINSQYLDEAVYKDKIIWQDSRNGNYDIFIYNSETKQEKEITTNPANQINPKIYENIIVWQDDRNKNYDIYIHDLETKQEKQLTTNPLEQINPKIYKNIIIWEEENQIVIYDLTQKQIIKTLSGKYANIYEDTIIGLRQTINQYTNDIFTYNLKTKTEKIITNENLPVAFSETPAIYKDIIVWRGRFKDIYNDFSFHIYNLSSETWIKSFSRLYLDKFSLYEDTVVWTDNSKNPKIRSNTDIYFYNISNQELKAVTCDPSYKSNPKIHQDKIIWRDLSYKKEEYKIYMFDMSNQFPTCQFSTNSKIIEGYNFLSQTHSDNPMDDNGHGTHCAAVAAGSGDGGLKGVAPDAKLYSYKIAYPDGKGSFSNIISAIERASDPNQDKDFSDHVDIISMSLGKKCKLKLGEYAPDCGIKDALNQAVNNAVDIGIVVVAGAGNSGPEQETINTPGTAEKAITVGASFSKNYNDKFFASDCFEGNPGINNVACFSSKGPVKEGESNYIKPDILAPGVEICAAQWSSLINEDFNNPDRPDMHNCLNMHITCSGTSMATPHVAGAVALLKQANPSLTPKQIKDILKQTATDLGLDETIQGAGRLNIAKAIELANGISLQDCKTDIDENNIINIIDFLIVRNNLRRKNCSPDNNYCDRTDVDRDGEVKISDFLKVRNSLGKTC